MTSPMERDFSPEGHRCGFVDVEDSQADAAVEAMNETEMDGRKIFVSVARPKRESGDW